MEDRLLSLNDDVDCDQFRCDKQGNNTSENVFSYKTNSYSYLEDKDPSHRSKETITTSDTDLVSRVSSDQISTNETMPEVKIYSKFQCIILRSYHQNVSKEIHTQ